MLRNMGWIVIAGISIVIGVLLFVYRSGADAVGRVLSKWGRLDFERDEELKKKRAEHQERQREIIKSNREADEQLKQFESDEIDRLTKNNDELLDAVNERGDEWKLGKW